MLKIKNYIVLLLVLFSTVWAFAQKSTISPYSKYGVGLLIPENFNQNFGMGGAGLGLRSNTNINYLNPASYSELTITTVEFGLTTSGLWLENGTQSQFQNNTYINHIAFGFPVINNKWGMSFGIMPYSKVGYDYHNTVSDSVAGDIDFYYKGDGGLNQVYFGNAVKFKIDTTSNISVGFNGSVLFGNFTSDKKVIYGDLANSYNLWEFSRTSIVDLNFIGGIQYTKSFRNAKAEKYNLILGTTYELAADLNAEQTQLNRTFKGNIDFGTIEDTIVNTVDVPTILELPSKIGVGVVFEKENKWILAADVKSASWGQLTQPVNQNYAYQNDLTLNAGVEYIPDYNSFNHYFKRVKYRLGFRYSTGYLKVDNQSISDYGITFGLFLPVKRTDTAFPGLNIAIEYGGRGKASAGLVQEKYLNFNLGITINDRWFIKRKYD